VGVTIGFVGAGQFAPAFIALFKCHPDVDEVYVTDLHAERAKAAVERFNLGGSFGSFDELLSSSCDAVAIFTQRWTHGQFVLQALKAGKHVYSAVPMAITYDEIAAIVETVAQTGLIYAMGETSFYNPAAVYARRRFAAGEFGRVFYAEGDYVHDMDLGFYSAYRYSGGDRWKETASFPPMLYPTHAIGGVLSVLPAYAVSVSCLGVRDDSGDGVFDRNVSMFDNDFSNASALFELSDGGIMRTNEMRRVGYPSPIRESRFRFFGTKASFEQLAHVSVWQDKHTVTDISDLLAPAKPTEEGSDCGYAPVHDLARLPARYASVPNGHEGSHPFLADDFVRAVLTGAPPPVNAWVAARFTLPGIIAHQSAQREGERLPIPDVGDPPVRAV
jgi:predicted dehydrogenase